MATNPLHEARRSIADLRAPNGIIYWSDLVASVAATWGAIAVAARVAGGSAPFVLATTVAGLALTRALLFVHEITHLRPGALPGFRLAWNALVGVPLLAPSFIYETVHLDHHRVSVYRTVNDPEHAPDEKTLFQRCAVAVAGALLLPAILAFRWGVMTPLSLLDARLRRWVLARFSSLSANLKYRPSPLGPRARRQATLAEAAASIWVVALVALVAGAVIPMRAVAAAWIAMSIAMAVTDLRGEILHRFSNQGSFGTLERQVRDSVNVPHTGLASRLLLPVGIGYHALHHLDASLPYHAMAQAHARLQATLPATALYRRATSTGIWAATRQAIADDAHGVDAIAVPNASVNRA
jgi:fatty acid desaturase